MLLKVETVFRDNKNRITDYQISNDNGVSRRVSAEQLKKSLKSGEVQLSNYKLTKDNRLIPHKSNVAGSHVLMNKDRVVAYFDILTGTIIRNGLLPLDFNNIQDWLNDRVKFSCARDVKVFFKTIGIENTEDFIDVTHCVSLHDTFWVKRVESKLSWGTVSPYRHTYSEIVSVYALEGILLKGGNNYFSPVMSTNGSFPHTWKFTNTEIKFIKAGSKYTLGGSNSGREPFSEYFASMLGRYLHFNCVKYSIRNYRRHDNKIDVVTECPCYTSENIGSVSAHTLGLSSYEDVIDYCKSLSLDSYKTCLDMLFLDCLLLNTDRHFQNIEFLVDNDTLKVLSIAPIFDNNYSLAPRFIEGYDTFSRDDYSVRDGRTFEELYTLVKRHKSYRKELAKLREFKFEAPSYVSISDTRLKFLNDFLKMQISYLLTL